jgi:thiamine pyrophosphate-dependent acetolactate synthase large subunit-like protein
MVRTVADQFAEVLATAGVKRVYGIVGDGLNGLTDSLRRAKQVGIRAIRLEAAGEVEEGIAESLTRDGPVLVDVVVNRTELALPPSITVEMAKGFTLCMVKAILSGRGDEVIDLARTNLWR